MKVTKFIVRAGVISALYACLCILFAFSSFSTSLIQIRISEILTVLPLFMGESIIGLWIGCMVGNILSGSLLDVFVGSTATLIAGLMTYAVGRLVRHRALKVVLGVIPPVIVNAFIVPLSYTVFIGAGAEVYILQTLWVFIGQAITLSAGGVPFALTLQAKFFNKRTPMKEIKEKTNAKGQTLEEFLSEYNPSDWKHPSVTADCIILSQGKVLLVRRGNHPCIGELAFPGGFCEEGESAESTAIRELEEETGVKGVPCRQLYTVSTPNRDPRDWTITVCYYAVIDEPCVAKGGDDASSADFYEYLIGGDDDLTTLELSGKDGKTTTTLRVKRDVFGRIDVNATQILQNGMAFDHAKLLLLAVEEIARYE